MPEKLNQVNYTQNPALATVLPEWKGTPVDKKGRFVNEEFPFVVKWQDVLRWQLSSNPQREEKKKDTFRLKSRLSLEFLKEDRDCLVWLGHATFFLRLNGVQFMLDPVFYSVPFVKRYAQHAFGAAPFSNLDYLLLSHDHQDHCQQESIRKLAAQNPSLTVLSGLNMEGLLKPWIAGATIQTAGWYQQFSVPGQIRIYFLPTRHWSKRGLKDDNSRLWGAFVIQAGEKTLYFGGDSGYGSHYAAAKKLFPKIDVAMIGCGAFKPEWFMEPNHSSPEDAVRAFHELGAKRLLPMHHGTFDLSDEPVGEPYRRLKAMEQEGKIRGEVSFLDLGEVVYF